MVSALRGFTRAANFVVAASVTSRLTRSNYLVVSKVMVDNLAGSVYFVGVAFFSITPVKQFVSFGGALSLVALLSSCSGPSGGPGTYEIDQNGLELKIEIPAEPEGLAVDYLAYADDTDNASPITWVRVSAANTTSEARHLCEVTVLDEEGVRFEAVGLSKLVADIRDPLLGRDTQGFNEGVRIGNQLLDVVTVGELLPGETRSFLLALEGEVSSPSAVFSGEGLETYFDCDTKAKKVD